MDTASSTAMLSAASTGNQRRIMASFVTGRASDQGASGWL
jgi:hypothetical protein